MTAATLLVELCTEELPPKSLMRLAEAFRDTLAEDLRQNGFLNADSAARVYATPRRIAVQITRVLEKAPDRALEITGPSVKAGLDKDGKPTPALNGFAKKNGVTIDALVQIDTPKGKVYACRKVASGGMLSTSLDLMVTEALRRLPVAKMMRWGSGEAEFVRPVHGLMMLHGATVVPGTVLGVASGNRTRGHRFMGHGEIVVPGADAYEALLESSGMVVADFGKRRAEIDRLLQEAAGREGGVLGDYQDLLDEVAALVEHPTVYTGAFDAGFLDVPQECLILTMRQNQKYFPLFDASGKLTSRFLIVSNMRVADPRHIVDGNQRVVRPRLEDARFFYDQDRKTRLEQRVPGLKSVVYHNRLGSLLERVERIQLISGTIARTLGADPLLAERAAWLSKADLVTGMVGEFPELQGVMGRYYALHDGEKADVADAVEAHYRPRHAGGELPAGHIACSVALADKLEAMAGMFGIGQLPTGDKDPFALRRQALGVVRILIERDLPLSLTDLVDTAFSAFGGERKLADARADLRTFIYDRMRGYFADAGYTTNEIESVLSQRPADARVIPGRLAAVRSFMALPDAESLAAANKRVLNIINKNEDIRHKFVAPDRKLMSEAAELALMDGVEKLSPVAERHFRAGEYTEALLLLANIRPAVDRFFDEVMVMVDDVGVRNNRAALLQQLGTLMNRVADLSKLAA